MNMWQRVNRNLIAKGIAELSYEQILAPEDLGGGTYRLRLDHGIHYEFKAWKTIWDYLRIDAGNLERFPATENLRADQFYIDIKDKHGMSDITLANFLEELYRTQWSDLKAMEWQKLHDDADLLELKESVLQTLLDGHPKALVNKGRIGWSQTDLEAFAPESAEPFRLHWIAIRKDLLWEEFAQGMDAEARLRGCMSADEAARLLKEFSLRGLDLQDYSLVPLHPWQWNEVIVFHFQNEIQEGSFIPLGFFGDRYRPQTSLRTLTSETDSRRLQIKLPVSILNTSCVRGIDGKYIPISPKLTETLRTICSHDEKLKNVLILGDVSGAFVPHKMYAGLEEAPYRFKEFLGCIWRESPESVLEDDERCILTAALFHKGFNQKAFLGQVIAKSGLTTGEWMKAYFETVVIPLYHLQLKYGVGLVSHGQNIMLGLKDYRPAKLLIKDFQGDLRLLDKDIPELNAFTSDLKQTLTRLPAPYLIHDLLTGHFVTVLRFISAVLCEDSGYPEQEFYGILGACLRSYHDSVPEYSRRVEALGILNAAIPRVLVNKVRFHIGYGDSALRPVPMVGTDLKNPLYEDRHVSHA